MTPEEEAKAVELAGVVERAGPAYGSTARSLASALLAMRAQRDEARRKALEEAASVAFDEADEWPESMPQRHAAMTVALRVRDLIDREKPRVEYVRADLLEAANKRIAELEAGWDRTVARALAEREAMAGVEAVARVIDRTNRTADGSHIGLDERLREAIIELDEARRAAKK